MRFLNHHYTHNSDVAICARLKRTPATINITNHGPCQSNSLEIYWGKPSMPSFSQEKGNLQMQSTAVLALQEAAKFFMIDVFSNTNLCTMHSKRVTIKV